MKWIECPAPGCGKRIKSLRSHYRSSHPDLDIPDLRDLEPSPKPEQPKEPSQERMASNHESPQEQPQPPDPMEEKLRMIGIEPAQVDAFFETRVIKVLEKMKLGEVINNRIAKVETKLGERIKPITDLVEQAKVQTPGNGGEGAGGAVPSGRNALMDTVLAG